MFDRQIFDSLKVDFAVIFFDQLLPFFFQIEQISVCFKQILSVLFSGGFRENVNPSNLMREKVSIECIDQIRLHLTPSDLRTLDGEAFLNHSSIKTSGFSGDNM